MTGQARDAAPKHPLDGYSDIVLVNALCRLLRDDDREAHVAGMLNPIPASTIARYILGESDA